MNKYNILIKFKLVVVIFLSIIEVITIYLIIFIMPFVSKIYVNYCDCEVGQIFQLPGLLTEKGLIISHQRYLAWNCNKSESWKERSVFALRLLIDYINVNQNVSKATHLLKSFTLALVTGTIDYKNVTDTLDLYWRPRKVSDANNILHHITQYTDFLAIQDGFEHSRVNPFRKAKSYEERLNWCSYYHKQTNVFLNHLTSSHEAKSLVQQVRIIGSFENPNIDTEPAVRFPEEHLDRLLSIGCRKNDNTIDYQLQVMIMLMNFGGIRKSELFHIYVSDITLNPVRQNEALVRIYHPEIGNPPDLKYQNRKEYLESTSSYTSRNKYRLSERLYAGWKSPLLTSKKGYFELVFCPPNMGEVFLKVWANYLKYKRVEPPKNKPHPFAFTQTDGSPETLKNFQRKYEGVVKRIGLAYSKLSGTTEHGHRHAYGFRAKSFGLDAVAMQKAMHHKSAFSHLVYTQPTNEEIRKKMNGIE